MLLPFCLCILIIMPFQTKIRPIDAQATEELTRLEPVKQVAKSRFKRLLERQFPSVLRNSIAEKVDIPEEQRSSKDEPAEFEPSSVCLANMVQNFIEENNSEKQSGVVRCSRNCFNGNCDDSDDDFDWFGGCGGLNVPSSGEASEALKSLVSCASVIERNLLADTAKIVENNKVCKRKDDTGRKIVSDGLLALGYDASICKSHWEKAASYPAGDYEYIDVVMDGHRLLIDVDFRSEFEIARSTKTYKSVLQIVPYIFVGKADRLQKIVTLMSESAKQSLKKKGMHIPPWRKAEYLKAKWLSPYIRVRPHPNPPKPDQPPEKEASAPESGQSCVEKSLVVKDESKESVFNLFGRSDVEEKSVKEWKPPGLKPKSFQSGVKLVTGLASIMGD